MVKVKDEKNKNDIRKKSKRKEKSEEQRKYEKYIRSKEFRKVRDAVRERDKCCQCCGRTPEEVEGTKITMTTHHRTYRHLFENGEQEIADCILLCSVCHRAIHAAKSNLRRFKR